MRPDLNETNRTIGQPVDWRRAAIRVAAYVAVLGVAIAGVYYVTRGGRPRPRLSPRVTLMRPHQVR